MDISLIAQIAAPLSTAGIGIAGAVAAGRRSSNSRERLTKDIELLKSLTVGTDTYRALADHIEWQVKEVSYRERHMTRELGTGLAALLVAVLLTAWGAYVVAQGGHWLWNLLYVIPLIITLMVGTFDSLRSVERDDKGSPIEKKSTDDDTTGTPS